MSRRFAAQRLVIASHNLGKVREIEALLTPFGVAVVSAGALGLPEPEETGTTFAENAALKAHAYHAAAGLPTLAEDSGLEVDALGGAPGIYSARYAGARATQKEKIDKLLRELARVGTRDDARRARFRCVVALARNGNLLGTFEGTVEGRIAAEPQGASGFGYDPIFVPKGFGQTFGELPAEVKNRISHRGKAIRALAASLRRL
jgi:XTP/dITP diphosphohydrolase